MHQGYLFALKIKYATQEAIFYLWQQNYCFFESPTQLNLHHLFWAVWDVATSSYLVNVKSFWSLLERLERIWWKKWNQICMSLKIISYSKMIETLCQNKTHFPPDLWCVCMLTQFLGLMSWIMHTLQSHGEAITRETKISNVLSIYILRSVGWFSTSHNDNFFEVHTAFPGVPRNFRAHCDTLQYTICQGVSCSSSTEWSGMIHLQSVNIHSFSF